MATNYHHILGVSADASPIIIKAAYRRLVRRYHPDLSAEKDATEKFVEVVNAYRAWEAVHFQKVEQVAPAFAAAPSAAKSDKYSAPAAADGKDCEITAHLSVEELYWGVELKLNATALCPGRRGKKSGSAASLLKVKIRRGTRAGTKLCLRGKGEAGRNGGNAGNVYVSLKLKPHERYEVVGSDLFVDMPLSVWEAKEGARVDVVTPAGRIEVDVPAGIASGQSVRVPQRGLPSDEHNRGDLFAVARVTSANKRTEKLRQWPHLLHTDRKRWQPAAAITGRTIDVRC